MRLFGIINLLISTDFDRNSASGAGVTIEFGAMRDSCRIILCRYCRCGLPPVNLKTTLSVRKKLKVIEAIEDITPEFLRKMLSLANRKGCYRHCASCRGYKKENIQDSNTETFVAMKLHINNFR